MPFAIDIHNVIHGRSQYPQLHRVYRNRHNAGVRKLSRCPDKFKVKRTKRVKGKPVYARTDSREFQLNTKYNDFPFIGMEWNRNEREMGMRTFLMECCPTLTERFIIYGTIGRGCKYFPDQRTFIQACLRQIDCSSLWGCIRCPREKPTTGTGSETLRFEGGTPCPYLQRK